MYYTEDSKQANKQEVPDMTKTLPAQLNQAIVFNTGRHYSPEGQVISARVVEEIPEANRLICDFPEFVVLFDDKTRGIRGEVKVIPWNNNLITQEEIMREYDTGRYTAA